MTKKTAKKDKVKLSSKKTKIIIITLIVLLTITIILILVAAGILDMSRLARNEVKVFQSQDKCSLIVGKLIHVIRDSDDCRINCRADCNVRQLEFVDSNFTASFTSCNQCTCYCK